MQFQLRIYRIQEGAIDEFVREWRELVLPLRARLGFSVVGPWVNRDESRFVWLVGYDGNVREANERYYASDERAAMDPDPARLVAESTTVWLDPIAIEEKETT
jgi:hypothetical protein